jgi:hypothetical protein
MALLLESGDYLLTESDGYLLLESEGNFSATLTSPTEITLRWSLNMARPTVDIEIDGTIVEYDYEGTSYVHTIVEGSQHNYRIRTVAAAGDVFTELFGSNF